MLNSTQEQEMTYEVMRYNGVKMLCSKESKDFNLRGLSTYRKPLPLSEKLAVNLPIGQKITISQLANMCLWEVENNTVISFPFRQDFHKHLHKLFGSNMFKLENSLPDGLYCWDEVFDLDIIVIYSTIDTKDGLGRRLISYQNEDGNIEVYELNVFYDKIKDGLYKWSDFYLSMNLDLWVVYQHSATALLEPNNRGNGREPVFTILEDGVYEYVEALKTRIPSIVKRPGWYKVYRLNRSSSM